MKKYFVPGHFINPPEKLANLQKELSEYRVLIDLLNLKFNDFEFWLRLSKDPNLKELNEQTKEILSNKLPKNVNLFYNESRGPGFASREVLLNPLFKGGLVFNVCLDQQVVATKEAAERIIDLSSKIERDNSLYGVGSRTVPVRLSRHLDNNYLRVIQELFFAIAAESGGPLERLEGVTPAYARFGDTSTGMDVINTAHSKYSEVVKGMINAMLLPIWMDLQLVIMCLLKQEICQKELLQVMHALMKTSFPVK
jgi:hypothetical protein